MIKFIKEIYQQISNGVKNLNEQTSKLEEYKTKLTDRMKQILSKIQLCSENRETILYAKKKMKKI